MPMYERTGPCDDEAVGVVRIEEDVVYQLRLHDYKRY